MRSKAIHFFMFLVGLLSMVRVRVVGMIGISELLICMAAPVLLFLDFQKLRRDGFLPICGLTLATCIGCVVGTIANNTPFELFVRGFATPVVFFCAIVFIHHFIEKDVLSVRWLLVGSAFSIMLSFMFQGVSVEDVLTNNIEASAGDSNYMLTVMLSPFFTVPILIWYEKMPYLLACAFLGSSALFKILTTESGRSATLAALGSMLLIYIGRKSVKRMVAIKKHFVVFMLVAVSSLLVIKVMYSVAAEHGLLGERSKQKYELQTRAGTGVLSLLIGGRAEAFIGAYAAWDKPIIGFGPWAMDTHGYQKEFTERFGVVDLEAEAAHRRTMQMFGISESLRPIPAHSYITCFWLWYGIFGLILWLYVLLLIVNYFRRYVDAVPQWYCFLAIALPRLIWDILFSPFGGRVSAATSVCLLLLARAYWRGCRRPDQGFMVQYLKYVP